MIDKAAYADVRAIIKAIRALRKARPDSKVISFSIDADAGDMLAETLERLMCDAAESQYKPGKVN